MSSINDAVYLNGDLTATVKQLSPVLNSFCYRGKDSLISGYDPINLWTITMVAYEQIVVGEEFFVDYRRDYMSPTSP